MKILLVILFCAIAFTTSCGGNPDVAGEDPVKDEYASAEETKTSVDEPLVFLDDFYEYGYTEEQISKMKTILLNVGIQEISELEIEPVVYGMQVIKGKVENKHLKDIDVQFNIESGAIYLVTIYCSNTWTAIDGLEDERADLYYDAKGGYLKKIDWVKKSLVDY